MKRSADERHRAHYVKPISRPARPRRVLYLDTETKVIAQRDGTDFHRFRLAVTCLVFYRQDGSVSREEWLTWARRDDVLKYIHEQARPTRPLVILGSNPGFDLWVLDFYRGMGRLGWRLDFMYDQDVTFILRARRDRQTVLVLAIQNWLRQSIRDLGPWVGVEYLPVDHQTVRPSALLEHCRRDVAILRLSFETYLAFLAEHDLGPWRMTLASQAWACYRYRHLSVRHLVMENPKVRELAAAAIYPARVECRWTGQDWRDDWVKLDVNSLYPWVMSEFGYPGDLVGCFSRHSPEWLARWVQGHCVIARVRLHTGTALYPVREGKRIRYPTGSFSTVLASASLRAALDRGHLVEVEQAVVWEQVFPFQAYVQALGPLKQSSTESGDQVTGSIVKGLLNRLWGRFARHVPTIVKVEECEGQLLFHEAATDVLTGHPSRATACMGTRWIEKGRHLSPDAIPELAAHVADYASCWLWHVMGLVGHDRIVYCDADAFITTRNRLSRIPTFLHRSQLGKLRIAGTGNRLTIYGEKDYILGTRVVVKGIKAGACELSPRLWEYEEWPGFTGLAGRVEPGIYPVRRVRRKYPQAPRNHATTWAPEIPGGHVQQAAP